MSSTPVASISFVVDDDAFVRAMHRAEDAVDGLIKLVALSVAESLQEEGGQLSNRLNEPWNVSGTGPFERHVEAPEAGWFAHILAHGASPHGAVRAERLVFAIDGGIISPESVRGVPANPFDERALDKARSHVDDIIRLLIAEAT